MQTHVTFAVHILDGAGGSSVSDSISPTSLQQNLAHYVEQGGCASSPCRDPKGCK